MTNYVVVCYFLSVTVKFIIELYHESLKCHEMKNLLNWTEGFTPIQTRFGT